MEGTLLGSVSDMNRAQRGEGWQVMVHSSVLKHWLGHTVLSTEAWKVDMLHSSVIGNKDRLGPWDLRRSLGLDKELGLTLTGPEKLWRIVTREVISELDWHREEARSGYQTEGQVKSTEGPNPVVVVRIQHVFESHKCEQKLQRWTWHRSLGNRPYEGQGIKNSRFLSLEWLRRVLPLTETRKWAR